MSQPPMKGSRNQIPCLFSPTTEEQAASSSSGNSAASIAFSTRIGTFVLPIDMHGVAR